MLATIQIEELHSIEKEIVPLSKMLKLVVDNGASVGFVPPLAYAEAKAYWETVLNPEVILFIAKINGEIAGSVQLHRCTKPNGLHRAEIAKLMTHPEFRRMGIGRELMKAAEERAQMEGRTLLMLNTREGDVSNLFYQSLGFAEAGKVPYYARSAGGKLDSTVFYFKRIQFKIPY